MWYCRRGVGVKGRTARCDCFKKLLIRWSLAVAAGADTYLTDANHIYNPRSRWKPALPLIPHSQPLTRQGHWHFWYQPELIRRVAYTHTLTFCIYNPLLAPRADLELSVATESRINVENNNNNNRGSSIKLFCYCQFHFSCWEVVASAPTENAVYFWCWPQ